MPEIETDSLLDVLALLFAAAGSLFFVVKDRLARERRRGGPTASPRSGVLR